MLNPAFGMDIERKTLFSSWRLGAYRQKDEVTPDLRRGKHWHRKAGVEHPLGCGLKSNQD